MEPMQQATVEVPTTDAPDVGVPSVPYSELKTINDLLGLMEHHLMRWKRDCIEYVEWGPGKLRFRFYTDVNSYAITAKEPIVRNDPPGCDHFDPSESGYLGCVSSCRKPRAGEDWRRGNDLADGPFNMETWNRIMHDIVAYEVVQIAKGVNKIPPPNIE